MNRRRVCFLDFLLAIPQICRVWPSDFRALRSDDGHVQYSVNVPYGRLISINTEVNLPMVAESQRCCATSCESRRDNPH